MRTIEDLYANIRKIEGYERIEYLSDTMRIAISMYITMFPENINFIQDLIERVDDYIESEKLTNDEKDLIYADMAKNSSNLAFMAARDFKSQTGVDLIFSMKTMEESLTSCVVWDNKLFSTLVLAFCLDIFTKDLSIPDILQREIIEETDHDYHLVKLNDYEFYEDGIIQNGRCYLYNKRLFLNKLKINDDLPGVVTILEENKNNGNIYFRLDRKLSVPLSEKIQYTYKEYANYYGPAFDFMSVDKYRFEKGIFLKYNPNTFDKLLMVIEPDYDSKLDKPFFNIGVEMLPNPENIKEDYFVTTYVHGKYYTDAGIFNHIDLATNHYSMSDYKKKFDVENVDLHTENKEFHYKQWCIEDGEYSKITWYRLVKMSLKSTFWDLFDEIIQDEDLLK